ncbi:MAG TPA: hypothetical protein VGA78_15225 [Gemmatimonadales bacterium]
MKVIALVLVPGTLLGMSVLPLTLTSVSVTPGSLNVGQSATGSVRFDAPVGIGTRVTLSSKPTTVATVPSSVRMLAGATSVNFTVSTLSAGCAKVFVTSGNVTRFTDLWVHSVSGSVRLTTDKVAAQLPATFTGTVSITRPRGSTTSLGGDLVSLSSSNPAVASVPRSVTVPAGATTASFAIRPTGYGCAVITASYSGGTSRRAMSVLADG